MENLVANYPGAATQPQVPQIMQYVTSWKDSPLRGSMPTESFRLLEVDYCESFQQTQVRPRLFTNSMQAYMEKIKSSLTAIQKETMELTVLPLLDALPLSVKICGECMPGFSVEEELFFQRKDERGIHYLLVDAEGTIAYGRVGTKPGDYELVDDADGFANNSLVNLFIGSQKLSD